MRDADAADLLSAEPDAGLSIQGHTAPDISGGIWTPDRDHHSAHTLARLKWAAVPKLGRNDVHRLVGVITRSNASDGDYSRSDDQVIGVQLVGFRCDGRAH